MKIISSEAGERMAKARAAMIAANDAIDVNNPLETKHAFAMAHYEFCQAAKEVADELVSQGFGNAEGD